MTNPADEQPSDQNQPYGQNPPGYPPAGGAPQSGYGPPGYGPPGGAPGYAPPGYGAPGYGPPGYAAPGYGPPPGARGWGADPSAPFGRDPMTGLPLSDKSKLTAGLLQLFLGGFGIGRFYTGHTGIALGQLFTCGGCGVWALIDAIMMLTGKVTDPQGRPLSD